MNEATPDLLIIGGGLAGLTAGNRAATGGLSVLLLEAGVEEEYLCNSRISMGFINVAMRNISEGPDVMRSAIAATTKGHAEPELVEALANNAQAALVWLRGEGVRTIHGNWRPGSNSMLAPPAGIGAGLRWRGRGPDQMMRTLASHFIKRGGQIRRGARARELIMRDGVCCGVVAEIAGARVEIAARNVLIADGGFQGNPELLGKYVTPRPDRVLTRNAGTGRGDGLMMALTAGAATASMGGFYGHVQSADALHNPKLWPYPTVDMPISAGIVVNARGQRFTDEGYGGVYVANAIAKLDDPLDAFAIYDHAAWMQRATEFPRPANPLLVSAGATIHAAEDISTLAARAGLNAVVLTETIAGFNAAIATQTGPSLSPPRSTFFWRPMEISQPPFYAVPLVAGVTYTTGGIAIDRMTRVKSEKGSIIAGLYAAGSCTGGHEGGPYSGYTGGLGKALTFGFIAGNTIARSNASAAA